MPEDKEIKQIAESFKTYDEIYMLLIKGDFSICHRKSGTNEYPLIEWMTEYFIEKEEYEKCGFLKNLKLPEISDEKLKGELYIARIIEGITITPWMNIDLP